MQHVLFEMVCYLISNFGILFLLMGMNVRACGFFGPIKNGIPSSSTWGVLFLMVIVFIPSFIAYDVEVFQRSGTLTQ